MFRSSVAVLLSIIVMLSGCGGGGSSSSGPVASTLAFPLQSAVRTFFANGTGLSQSFSVSGSCTEAGTDSITAATTSTTFEGSPALSATQSTTFTSSNCRSVPVTYNSTMYLDSNFDELGSSSSGYYRVFQTTPTHPVSVHVGDTGTYGTADYYSDSTKATSTGYALYSYIIEPDTATTIVFNRIQRFYNMSGTLQSTRQSRFRVTSIGEVTLISADEVAGSYHWVYTYH